MKARIVDLRYRMKSALEALDRGEPVTVLDCGKAFGMWKEGHGRFGRMGANATGAAARLVERETDRAISIVSLMELIQGAKSKSAAAVIRSFLVDQEFCVVPIDEAISYVAAALIGEDAHSSGLRPGGGTDRRHQEKPR